MKKLIVVMMLLALTSCANPNREQYMADQAGIPLQVSFGTLLAAREIHIKNPTTGAGAGVGVAGGAIAGAAIGRSPIGLLAGALIGGIAGAVAEGEVSNFNGFEYTVTLEQGNTMTVAQYRGDDAILPVGSRVMVQFDQARTYMRVLPADALPEEIKRPKGVKVK